MPSNAGQSKTIHRKRWLIVRTIRPGVALILETGIQILNYATMENSDYLRPDNPVSVTILGPDNTRLYQATSTGYRSIEAAINAAVGSAALDVNPEDCVFEVANQATGVSHRYRINAHGNLKLIV